MGSVDSDRVGGKRRAGSHRREDVGLCIGIGERRVAGDQTATARHRSGEVAVPTIGGHDDVTDECMGIADLGAGDISGTQPCAGRGVGTRVAQHRTGRQQAGRDAGSTGVLGRDLGCLDLGFTRAQCDRITGVGLDRSTAVRRRRRGRAGQIKTARTGDRRSAHAAAIDATLGGDAGIAITHPDAVTELGADIHAARIDHDRTQRDTRRYAGANTFRMHIGIHTRRHTQLRR